MSTQTIRLTAQQATHEERLFRRGQEATASMIRALAVPDRSVQLAIARLMIETRQRAAGVIALAKCAEAGQETWSDGSPDRETLVGSLETWYHEGITDSDKHQSRAAYAPASDAS